jgi:hypothetical protein
VQTLELHLQVLMALARTKDCHVITLVLALTVLFVSVNAYSDKKKYEGLAALEKIRHNVLGLVNTRDSA